MVLRIFKMIATSDFLTALECTKFVFGRGSTPVPTGGAYCTPPDPVAGLRALLLRGRRGTDERKRGREEEEKGRDGPPFANSWILPWFRYSFVDTVHRLVVTLILSCCH